LQLQKPLVALQVPPAHGHASMQWLLQTTWPPQPSLAEPLHWFSGHGSEFGVQPHPFAPAAPPPHVFGEVHVLGHVTVCPQLFTFGPHATPAQVTDKASGVQQFVPWQTSPALQLAGQPTSCAQAFFTVTPPHRPAHTLVESAQQLPSALQNAPFAHAPAFPQFTVCPQLLTAVPHSFVPQLVATGSGVQPHELFVQGWAFVQSPQSIVAPQLSVVWAQRFLHHCGSVLQMHFPLLHSLPFPQSVEQLRSAPQLSLVRPQLSAHVTVDGSGVQVLTLPPSGSKTGPPPSFPCGLITIPPSVPASGARCASSKSTPAIAPHPAATVNMAPSATMRGTKRIRAE
jgi:hypothetical protein